MAYGVVHDDYEGVAVVAAGLAAPKAVAHSLVVCQSRIGCVRIRDVVYRKDRLAFDFIGPVATSTAAFHHVVEVFVSLNAKVVGEAEFLFLSSIAGGGLSVVKQVSSSCDFAGFMRAIVVAYLAFTSTFSYR